MIEDLAHAGQCHLQRAWDRRRGKGQHMDVGLQFLQPLLVGDAEVLLFVDDDQAEAWNRFLASIAWVPTTMSTAPLASPCLAADLGGLTRRESGRP